MAVLQPEGILSEIYLYFALYFSFLNISTKEVILNWIQTYIWTF